MLCLSWPTQLEWWIDQFNNLGNKCEMLTIKFVNFLVIYIVFSHLRLLSVTLYTKGMLSLLAQKNVWIQSHFLFFFRLDKTTLDEGMKIIWPFLCWNMTKTLCVKFNNFLCFHQIFQQLVASTFKGWRKPTTLIQGKGKWIK